jgi:hypothetical protein
MKQKSCNRCGLAARFSLACLLSTIGQKPRRQKCTRSVLLCASCIRGFCEGLASAAPDPLIGSLTEAYMHLDPQPRIGSDLQSAPNPDANAELTSKSPSVA